MLPMSQGKHRCKQYGHMASLAALLLSQQGRYMSEAYTKILQKPSEQTAWGWLHLDQEVAGCGDQGVEDQPLGQEAIIVWSQA